LVTLCKTPDPLTVDTFIETNQPIQLKKCVHTFSVLRKCCYYGFM